MLAKTMLSKHLRFLLLLGGFFKCYSFFVLSIFILVIYINEDSTILERRCIFEHGIILVESTMPFLIFKVEISKIL